MNHFVQEVLFYLCGAGLRCWADPDSRRQPDSAGHRVRVLVQNRGRGRRLGAKDGASQPLAWATLPRISPDENPPSCKLFFHVPLPHLHSSCCGDSCVLYPHAQDLGNEVQLNCLWHHLSAFHSPCLPLPMLSMSCACAFKKKLNPAFSFSHLSLSHPASVTPRMAYSTHMIC